MSIDIDHTGWTEVALVVQDEDLLRDAISDAIGNHKNVDVWVRPAAGGDEWRLGHVDSDGTNDVDLRRLDTGASEDKLMIGDAVLFFFKEKSAAVRFKLANG